MSSEIVSIEQHLTFVNKMRERVKGTDLEPIWERLHAYMTKINDLTEPKKTAIDTMIKKVIGKIEHFKNVSERRLEALNADITIENESEAQFETSQNFENQNNFSLSNQGSSSQPEQPAIPDHVFLQPKKKVKKFKRFSMTRQDYPHIVMSPRGDNIPVMRIRLSEIHNKRRQKEERKKNKKTKAIDLNDAAEQHEKSEELSIAEQIEPIEKSVENIPENQVVAEKIADAENVIQNPQDNIIPMEVERINEIASVHESMNENSFSKLNLKECSVHIEKCSPEKSTNDPEPVKTQPKALEPTNPSTQPALLLKNDPKKTEGLEKIPIEKSKSVAQNGSKNVDEHQFIYIVDSDDEDMTSNAVQNNNNTQKETPKIMTRLRKKSQYLESPINSNKTAQSPQVPKTPDTNLKNTKKSDSAKKPQLEATDSPKKPKLATGSQKNNDDSCIVTVTTVDLTIRPQLSVKNPPKSKSLEPKSPATPNVSSKCTELLNNVVKSAPVARLRGNKRNRNSIDTLPNSKIISQTVQNIVIRQSNRQAARRNSVTRTIDFEQESPSKPKEASEKSHGIKILSVESIKAPESILRKMIIPQPKVFLKKLPNARKSTSSNKVLLSRELSSSNQTPNNQISAVNADTVELTLSTKKVNNTSTEPQIAQNIDNVIKNEPQSPKSHMSPAMTEIPTSIMILEAQKDKKLVLLSSEATRNKIRPWIKTSEHRKFLKNCENMLANGFCLSALFKCMGSTCSYYTNNPAFFLRHLKVHQQKQANDMKYFSQCAYCNIINDNPDVLVQHISDTHGNNKYQCAYCFYRSCDFHIHTHHNLFHPLKSEAIMECKPLKELDIEKEFSNAWNNVMNVCKPIFCCVCKFKFYNIKNFENHYKAYPSVPTSRCLKCKFEINQETIMDHVKECHKFGDLNCAYCSFASDSSNAIKIHLSNMHIDKPMLYFDRTKHAENFNFKEKGPTNKEDILKAVVLKKLVHQEQTKTKTIKIFNDQNELDNANNINTGLLERHN